MKPALTDSGQLRELLGIPFTAEQLEAITAPAEPAVIVAGAGSGKTTVMAARVVWLVGTGQLRPDQVLGLTFTNKAAGELTERVRAALRAAGVGAEGDGPPSGASNATDSTDEAAGEPEISTYHAFAGRLLTDHGLRIGVEPTVQLLADASRYQLAAAVLRGQPGPYPSLTRSFPTLIRDLLALDGELAEHLVEPAELRAEDRRTVELLAARDPATRGNAWVRDVRAAMNGRLELTELVEAYRAEKRSRDLIDFGDQIALAARLARDRADVGQILRDQFAVVLLDEYQDTSVAQRLLLAALFGSGSGHAVTAVGDPCQSIYGWRGASVANLDDFPLHFPRADGTQAARYPLSENRRSGGRLLTLANHLAEPLRQRHAGVRELRPAPGAEQDGSVRGALLSTHDEELRWVADQIAHQVRSGTAPGEIAVLCRTGRDFPEFHAALVERDVPVEVVGLSGLLHLPEVADLVAVCEVLQDPTANDALVRLLIGPRWRIGPRDLALLGRRARDLVRVAPAGDAEDGPEARLAEAVAGSDPAEVVSLADAVADPGDQLPFSAHARVRFARLAAELRDLRRGLGDPLMDVLHRVLSVTGLDVELAASPHAVAARRRETLGRFLDIAGNFADLDGDASLTAFLGFLRTAAEFDKGLDSSLPGEDDTVKVLTAHRAKGLEWDVVALPSLVRGEFPNGRARERWTSNPEVLPYPLRGDAATLPEVDEWSKAGLDHFSDAMKDHQHTEELRLGYVAFTRPRRLLLGSGHWWGPSQRRSRGPSAFLEELRAHAEAGGGEIEVWADAPADGESNPALEQEAIQRPWPLPLDADSARMRHAAADEVRRQLRGRSAPHQRAGSAADGPGVPAADHGDALDVEVPHARQHPYPVPDEHARAEHAPDEPSSDEHGADEHGAVRDGSGTTATWTAAVVPPRQEPPPETVPLEELPSEGPPSEVATAEDQRVLDSWDRDLGTLAGELVRSRQGVREVPLPATLSASQLMRLAADPEGLARDLARPMPRPPTPAARRGTEFHAWVESRFQPLPLLEPDELPGMEDDGIRDEQDLRELKEAFLRTPYARHQPYRVEVSVRLRLGGRLVRGRIDAVYRVDGTGPAEDTDAESAPDAVYEVVDWKTSQEHTADPLQLAIYRVAWAERMRLPVQQVRAAFLYVRTGEVVRPKRLPEREELTRLLAPGTPPDADAFDASDGSSW